MKFFYVSQTSCVYFEAVLKYLMDGYVLLELLRSSACDLLGQPTWTHLRHGVPHVGPLCRRLQPLRIRGRTDQHRRTSAVRHRGKLQQTLHTAAVGDFVAVRKELENLSNG